MMDEQCYNRLKVLCDRWEGMLGSVGDTSIGYENAARELREIIDDETNVNKE